MVPRHPSSRQIVLLGAALGLLLLGCGSSGQLEVIQSQLATIENRVEEIQRDTASNEELAAVESRLSDDRATHLRAQGDLLTEVNRLTGKIAELEEQLRDTLYRIDQLGEQIASTNQELKALVATPPIRPSEGGRPPIDTSDPEALYQTAYNDYQLGNYRLAILGFAQYLETFPETDQADNALYWTGESYFSQRRYRQAIDAFSDVLARYPSSEKAASALLRRGFAYIEDGDRDEGISQLRTVVREHPSSVEADLARQQITNIDNAN